MGSTIPVRRTAVNYYIIKASLQAVVVVQKGKDNWSSRRQVGLDQLARLGVGLRVRSWESQTRPPALFLSKKSLLIAHSCRLSSLFTSTSPSRYTHIHIHNMSTYALPESHRDVSIQCALQIQARVLTMSSSWRSLSSRLTLRSPRS